MIKQETLQADVDSGSFKTTLMLLDTDNFKQADEYLFKAKQDGRNRLCYPPTTEELD